MTCAPHHLASQGASPRGEALKKARITLFAEENFMQARGEGTKPENFLNRPLSALRATLLAGIAFERQFGKDSRKIQSLKRLNLFC